MIRLDRSSVKFPVSLDLKKDTSAASRELARNIAAIETYNLDTSEKLELSFSAYSQPSVKSSVLAMTYNRCAYCGCREVRTKVQVEHYRPKAKLILSNNNSIKPGYYWLAGNWNNLLPACQYCNITRNSEVILNEVKIEAKTGKGNYFPVNNDNRTAPLLSGDEANESPLLFNPCTDNPYELFSYKHVKTNGEDYLVVIPNTELYEGDLKKKATSSISILGLNNLDLAADRFDILVRCDKSVSLLEKKLDDGVSGEQLKYYINELISFISFKKQNSFIGLSRKRAHSSILRARANLFINQNIISDDETVTVEKAISELEIFCSDYTNDIDYGVF